MFIGKLAHSDAPSCRLDDRLGGVREERAVAAGWDQAVVLDDRGVLLGWLSRDALESDPASGVASVMLEGPVTFRPNRIYRSLKTLRPALEYLEAIR